MTAQVVIAHCVCVGFQIYISRTQVVRRVYIATFMSNLAFMLMYLVNSDIGTMMSCGFITVRSLVYDIHGSLFIVVVGRAIMIATNLISDIQHRGEYFVPAVRINK